MSLIVSNIADTVHYWGTLQVLVESGSGKAAPRTAQFRQDVRFIQNSAANARYGFKFYTQLVPARAPRGVEIYRTNEKRGQIRFSADKC
jgi:hypothetical protein